MDLEIIKLKCPCCSTILKVKKVQDIEKKNIKCPVCNSISPYKLFKDISTTQSQSHTEYLESNNRNVEETHINVLPKFTFGELTVLNSNIKKLKLKTGKYIIGRQANSSIADFQIPTEGSNRMSKEHIVIEVKKLPQRGVIHYLSLYKEKVNDTYLNDEKMFFGDCIVLKNGDIIKLPDATIKFEILDDEGTDF